MKNKYTLIAALILTILSVSIFPVIALEQTPEKTFSTLRESTPHFMGKIGDQFGTLKFLYGEPLFSDKSLH